MLICQLRLSNWPVKCAGFVAVLLDRNTRGCRRLSWRFTSICVAIGFIFSQFYDPRKIDHVNRIENCRWFFGDSREHVTTEIKFPPRLIPFD